MTGLKSVVELDIKAQQALVADLFMNPSNNPRWMPGVAGIEPISGEPGEPGSVYRMVPRHNQRVFVATVLASHPPDETRLSLVAPDTSVSIRVRLHKLAWNRTRFISEETFRFNGLKGWVAGLLARPAIKRAHRQHVEAFKRFAESYY
jgi:hypothetical protein